MIIHSLEIPVDEFEYKSGWQLKPEGACMGDRCVPMPENPVVVSGTVDVRLVAGALGMPIVNDELHGLYGVGPASGGPLLASATCPDFAFPDLAGNIFRLSSLRGRKIVVVSWASW